MFAGKKSAQIREILISESAWEEMTCLFAPSLIYFEKGIGIYAVFLKILIIGMDFRARKGFYMDTLLIISSSHHQQFTSLFRV
ncbi:hypothetical protein OZG93_16530 [Escherichia coli]|nr:hypothetical protein [Escherichia coli]